MREKLFRGKRIDTGQWVYGGFTLDAIDNPRIIEKDGHGGLVFQEVIPETIGQYTGLKDRNDNRIFEGDIVETIDVPNPKRYKAVFYFLDDSREIPDGTQSAGFCLKDLAGKLMSFLSGKNMKITGNIHDNPELLEQEIEEDKQ
jgi:uncharacterized phage protein (TIGR01671 family)